MLQSPYEYLELPRHDNGGGKGIRLYETPEKERLPSVTTILSQTEDPEDKAGLENWRKAVGEANAKRITTEAANRGTVMHRRLEYYVKGIDKKVGGAPLQQQGYKMSQIIVEKGLKNMSAFWGSEVSLWFPGLYAGSTDLVGVWKGKPAIVDFKQANKPKKDEWINNYKTQLTAYALAHNEVYGTDIKTGVIMICTKDFEYQEFVLEGEEFESYTDKWLDRVELYYNNLDK